MSNLMVHNCCLARLCKLNKTHVKKEEQCRIHLHYKCEKVVETILYSFGKYEAFVSVPRNQNIQMAKIEHIRNRN